MLQLLNDKPWFIQQIIQQISIHYSPSPRARKTMAGRRRNRKCWVASAAVAAVCAKLAVVKAAAAAAVAAAELGQACHPLPGSHPLFC